MLSHGEKLLVYSYRRCPFAMRVRLLLCEKEIPFDVVEEDLSNFSDKLRSLHPEAKVPVLVHGERVLYESAIINEYIEDAFPASPRMPTEAGERSEVRLWTYWCNQFFKPDLDRFKYGTSRYTPEQCEGAETRLIEHLGKLEKRLSFCKWLVGDAFTLGDINVFPFCRQLARIKPEPKVFKDFPSVQKWMRSIESRPSYSKAMER